VDPLAAEPGPRWPQIAAFVASAAAAAAILRLTWARPSLVAALLGGALAYGLSRWLQDRVRTLRTAVLALARAFAHESRPGDRELLEAASETSPLVFWAMRYAAAVVAVDQHDFPRARGLLADAPAWPAESTFRAFHDEILRQLPAR
jgi:hypothetical protein